MRRQRQNARHDVTPQRVSSLSAWSSAYRDARRPLKRNVGGVKVVKRPVRFRSCLPNRSAEKRSAMPRSARQVRLLFARHRERERERERCGRASKHRSYQDSDTDLLLIDTGATINYLPTRTRFYTLLNPPIIDTLPCSHGLFHTFAFVATHIHSLSRSPHPTSARALLTPTPLLAQPPPPRLVERCTLTPAPVVFKTYPKEITTRRWGRWWGRW